MSKKNTLLVTFPVDLGNLTLQTNQHIIFRDEMDFFSFAAGHIHDNNFGKVRFIKSLTYRILSAFQLRRVVRKYTKEGKTILFHGLSPALFSFGVWKPAQTVIAIDWTRTLYTMIQGKPLKRDWIFKIHRKVLQSCLKFICWTDAVMINLEEVYGIDKTTLHKAPAPFLVERLDIQPRPTPRKPKVLFVGGDLIRKGGDVLIEGWKKFLKDKCFLTMVTNDSSADVEGIHFLPNVKYGSELHKRAFEEHDILILPTRNDSYPQVIGEAAAAGLAVITTKYALGAKEVIISGETGFITESPEETIQKLILLLNNPSLIDHFKLSGYNLMHKKFSKESIKACYRKILN